MADDRSYPWSEGRVARYLGEQFTTAFRDAAVLNHLRLRATETSVLELGCSDGTLAISTYKMLRSLTSSPITVVAIDSSPAMVNRARQRLAIEAGLHGADITRSVSFIVMEANQVDSATNLATIRATLPRGIAVIIAMNLVDIFPMNMRLGAIGKWVSPLAPQGRIVFNIHREPRICASAHIIHPVTKRQLATIDLAPQAVREDTERTMNQTVRELTDGGNSLDISPPSCTWVGTVLRDFASTSAEYTTPGVPINRHATSKPSQNRIYNTGSPAVVVANTSDQFIECLAFKKLDDDQTIERLVFGKLDDANPGKVDQKTLDLKAARCKLSPEAFIALVRYFVTLSRDGSGQHLKDVIHRYSDLIFGAHVAIPDNPIYQLRPAGVLVTIRRN